jgi:hypothetical protein
MKKLILALLLTFSASNCFANGSHDEAKPTGTKAELVTPIQPEAGKTYQVKIKLSDAAGNPLSLDKLKEVHTKKLHLLVNTPALDDYQHIHPDATNEPGVYEFSFTPKKGGAYRAWADITPLATDTQEYAVIDIGNAVTDRTTNMESTVNGMKFTLKFDTPLKPGEASMGHVTVQKDGKPFTQLEPVMGAFAHIVAFSEDFKSILHIHPMGVEPTHAEDRGGPQLDFHFQPHEKGFARLYVQTRVGGQDYFAPFGLVIE